jgi:hypothetical protein
MIKLRIKSSETGDLREYYFEVLRINATTQNIEAKFECSQSKILYCIQERSEGIGF